MKSFIANLCSGFVVWSLALHVAAAEAPAAGAASVSGSAGCGKPLAADVASGKTTSRTIASGGSNRVYLLHLPTAYDAGKPAPVVLNFHGFGGSAEQQNAISGFVPISDREGFILVTPDGGGAWRFLQSPRDANTAFVRDVVAAVNAELCVDLKRIFAAGKSQGGFMSSWLGCAGADYLAAIAPVSGLYEPTESCKPIPIMEFHGRSDSLIPFGGGRVLGLGNFAGAVAVMDKWARTNQCAGPADTVQVTPHVQRVTYRDCKAATVEVITDAGHTWPGTSVREGDNSTPADLPASELIWEFFKTHPRQ